MRTDSLFIIILFINSIVYGQNVGIGTSNPHISSILDIESSTKGFLPPRMDSIARNSIVSPVEGLTIYNTSTKSVEVYNGTDWYSTVHFIGESYGGGIVFYVYDNGQHGLIAATEDQSSGIRCHGGSIGNTRARADGIGAGLKNTMIIISHHELLDAAGSAATVCNQYSITSDNTTFGDFYLPSINELNLLYVQKDLIGGFSNSYYWSSTESVANDSWSLHFGTATLFSAPKGNTYRVRAIRSF